MYVLNANLRLHYGISLELVFNFIQPFRLGMVLGLPMSKIVSRVLL